jgi:hypothetical protein
MLSKPFTFKRVEALRSAIQEVTDECIDEILAGPQPADIVTKLALPVPTKVISEMLGVPYEDHEFFQHHANVGLARYASAEDGQKGAMSLHKYLINLVEAKMAIPRGEGTEDAVSDLAERVNAGEISVKEAAQLGTGLLIAGHETTANMIGSGVLALLENPEQAALLRDSNDPKFIANAAEELMRYLSIIQNGQRRVAIEAIEIGGETIRAGEGIILDLAPRTDAVAYPDPDKLDFTATRSAAGSATPPSVSGSSSPVPSFRSCSTLLKRIPTLRLAVPLDEVPLARPPPMASTNFRYLQPAIGVSTMPIYFHAHPPGVTARQRTGTVTRPNRMSGPAGTEVFSADNHISVPDSLARSSRTLGRRRCGSGMRTAPTWSAATVSFLPGDFSRVMQYDDRKRRHRQHRGPNPGTARGRRRWELAFRTPCWRSFITQTRNCGAGPHLHRMQPICGRSDGHFYGAIFINW